MKIALRMLGIFLLAGLLAAAWFGWNLYTEIQKAASEDPLVWEEDVVALEQASRGRFESGEAVVFIGSSSIRFWLTLERDMAPLPLLQHGFGGAKLNDLVHYAPRLVTAFAPRAVVVFAGTNDITPEESKSPAVLLASYQSFVQRVREDRPRLPVIFLAITPSPLRWTVWDVAQETNRLISEWSNRDPDLYVIDTAPGLLGADGNPVPGNYIFDGLHLSAQGYAVWADLIRPRLFEILGEDT